MSEDTELERLQQSNLRLRLDNDGLNEAVAYLREQIEGLEKQLAKALIRAENSASGFVEVNTKLIEAEAAAKKWEDLADHQAYGVDILAVKLTKAEAAVVQMREYLLDTANKYQLPSGEPGPLGYNCWGYQTIARHLREVALADPTSAAYAEKVKAAEILANEAVRLADGHWFDGAACTRNAAVCEPFIVALDAWRKEANHAQTD